MAASIRAKVFLCWFFAAAAFAAATAASPAQAQSGSSIAEETVRAVGNLLKGADLPSEQPPADQPAPGAEGADAPAASAPAPAAPAAGGPDVPGRLYARLTEKDGALASGLRWRVYRVAAESDGSHATVASSEEPQPVINVPAGDYVAVAVFGHAVGTKKFTVSADPFREAITLNAGGLRLTAMKYDGGDISPKAVKLSVYSAEQDEFGQRKLIVENAKPGQVIVLNAGTYHVVSQYGDANSTVRDEIKVEPAELTDARITHSAAAITLKLVNEAGGEALANTAWSVLSPAGDVVKESFGAFPTHILAAGDYSVIARHEGQLFNREFSVQPGIAQEVEVVAQ
ncbi:MAG: hypothetical protein H6878_11935 [Rhodobiaceae bacterium]|nr:hypothetical protein [Rhodobiaceae bacterium]MCC0016971.1 hypothetical protein [Rhodobiaceae bacterium]MCC0042347.1 hypothetical protein [Rhodobiaceae bacterium]MCC0054125.1 hypothetical protein [Rhodobiaceae bacterium]